MSVTSIQAVQTKTLLVRVRSPAKVRAPVVAMKSVPVFPMSWRMLVFIRIVPLAVKEPMVSEAASKVMPPLAAMTPEEVIPVAPVMAPAPVMSKLGVSRIEVVMVPEIRMALSMVPLPPSTILMALARLPPELVISIPSVIPEAAATSILMALSTIIVEPVVLSNCWIRRRFSVFTSVEAASLSALLMVTKFWVVALPALLT